MSVVELMRPEIQALDPYAAAEQVEEAVRLNANESPDTSASNRFRRPLNRYPEVRPRRLQAQLAARFGCRPEQLLVTRGSSEAIDLIIRSFCRAGHDSMVTHSPTFSMYGHYAEIQGADLIEVQTTGEQDFAIDVDALVDACRPETRLVFICSPNNPTGNLLPVPELERLLTARDQTSAVVVDEAYIEFASVPSVISLLDRHPNLLVLRTLSKALGCAGARCGAVIGPESVIRLLDAVQAPYALATPVVECVEEALQDEQLKRAHVMVGKIVDERERVASELANFGFVRKIWSSHANFLLVEVADADRVMRSCAEHNVLLRHFGGTLADCIRISIGSAAENDRLLGALNTISEVALG